MYQTRDLWLLSQTCYRLPYAAQQLWTAKTVHAPSFSVCCFFSFHKWCVWTANALIRMSICEGWSKSLLFICVLSILFADHSSKYGTLKFPEIWIPNVITRTIQKMKVWFTDARKHLTKADKMANSVVRPVYSNLPVTVFRIFKYSLSGQQLKAIKDAN